jgi:hypothetical protein
VSETNEQNNQPSQQQRTDGVAQAVECLTIKPKAMSSTPVQPKNKKTELIDSSLCSTSMGTNP